MNSRKYYVCIIDVYRASYTKHLKSKKVYKMEKKMK